MMPTITTHDEAKLVCDIFNQDSDDKKAVDFFFEYV